MEVNPVKKRLFGKKPRHRSRGWSRRGSSTMEYVVVIAVGALFAGLLYMTMSDGEGLIQSALEKKVLEIIQGQLSEGDVSSGNTSGLNGSPDLDNASGLDPFAGNPETGGFPDAGIPPEMSGAFDRSGTTPGVLPVESRIQPFPGDGSVRPVSEGDPSASTASGEDGWFSGWWNKTKNYVTSGQILKDAAHIGKETLDFLVLDDVSGCFTGKDTDGNRVAGWERGLRCVSLIPAAKVAKLGKFADEALAFAGKLDGKLVSTRLGEGLQTAKRKVEDLFGRGKLSACLCNSRNHFLKEISPPKHNTDEAYESYFEAILGKRLRSVKGTDLALPNSPVNIPGKVLDQWIKDGRIRRGVPHELDNYLRNYKAKKIQLDKDLIVTIDKDSMKHILESHHPKHFNPDSRFTSKRNVKKNNSLFPNNMTEKDVEQLLIRILQREKNEISKLAHRASPERAFQIGGDKSEKAIIVDGIKYVVGFKQEF